MKEPNTLNQNAAEPKLTENKYRPFVPIFSEDGVIKEGTKIARLFDETPEQNTWGRAPWDHYGYSRDAWIV